MENNNFTDLLNDKNQKMVKTKSLTIQGHLLKWENVVIQISNISLITSSDINAIKFPTWAAILSLLGIIMIFSEFFAMLALLFLSMGIVGICTWVWYTQKLKKYKYLNIQLNSGNTYSILFENENFLKEVIQVFDNIFKEGSKSGTNYYIDLNGCTIDNNSSVVNSISK